MAWRENGSGARWPSTLAASLALLLAALRVRRPAALQRRGAGAGLVALAAALPWLRLLLLRWWEAQRWRIRRRFLVFASPLQGSVTKQALPFGRDARPRWPWSWGPDRWRGFCPNCKRPVDAYLSEAWRTIAPAQEVRGKYAFLICLWGSSANYLVGAMVLGYSLKRTGSRHSRVCLYTDDVPAGHVEILSRLWDCRPIEHVDACVRSLSFSEKEDRFEKVFTKLRGMQLTEFEKVLMMDIDLLVRSNIDELFDLPAPAAMRRGMNDRFPYRTGDKLDGRNFFLGRDRTKWSWGQGTGINAGVMLWHPDASTWEQMLAEIQEPSHPEHCKGNGPEQDFLSRYWADAPWTHIGVEYNFQLHQMFFALHPDRADRAERVLLTGQPEKIKIVHFSGEPTAKPWHRVLDSKWADFWPDRSRDEEYTKLFADEFLGHWLWVKKDRASFDTSSSNPKNWDMEGMFLDEQGEIYRKPWSGEEPPEHLIVPEDGARNVMNFLGAALREWFDALQALEAELGFDLRERLGATAGPPAPAPAAGSTGGTDAVVEAQSPVLPSVRLFDWRRHGGRSGWWVEECEDSEDLALPSSLSGGLNGSSGGDVLEFAGVYKATVVCGATSSGRFVSFVEGGVSTMEEQEPDLSGVFVKVAGRHSPRHIRLPGDEEPGNLEEALVPVHLWADGVPPGAGVLIAFVGLGPEALAAALAALAPLGVPQTAPPAGCRALAAAGSRPCAGGGRPSEGRTGRRSFRSGQASGSKDGGLGEALYSAHASRDVAYAAVMLPPARS
uniref:Hexosyltransferase n=1 Tax=Alexandrium monilatum TaxID=311494 RepID=A0A7S4V1T2_9DINO